MLHFIPCYSALYTSVLQIDVESVPISMRSLVSFLVVIARQLRSVVRYATRGRSGMSDETLRDAGVNDRHHDGLQVLAADSSFGTGQNKDDL